MCTLSTKLVRGRHFSFIGYPDSLMPNWIEILEASQLPCFISPLHNADFNDDGTPKKSHYHIIISFNNTVTIKQAQEVMISVQGVHLEAIKHFPNSVAYLIHKFSPNKAQYSKEDVIALNGADFETSLPKSDNSSLLSDVMRVLRSNQVRNLYELFEILSKDGDVQLLNFCIDHAYLVRSLVQDCLKTKVLNSEIEYFNATRVNVDF